MRAYLSNLWNESRILWAKLKSPFSESALMIGKFTLELRGPDGELKEYRVYKNLITNVGFDYACASLGDSGSRPAVANYIAIGSSSTAEAAGNTTLGTELDRKLATYSHTGGTKVYALEVTFNAGEGTGTVQESGCLNAASGGTLFNRRAFGAITKGAADQLTVTWQFTLS